MFAQMLASLRNHEYWTYTSWMKLGLGYRKTSFGPLWMLASPAVFVAFLGWLFAEIYQVPREIFVPHLALGYITWLFILSVLNSAPVLFLKKRSEILQGQMRLTDLVFSEVFVAFLQFAHTLIIVAAVFIIFKIVPPISSWISLIGVALLVLNAIWFFLVFGILGSRFRDVVEINQAIGRLFFFITPIIWIPQDGQGGVMGAFLFLNPFYHFLELVRAPLLGNPVAPLSWYVVIAITVFGFAFAAYLFRRTGRQVPLWV